MYKIEIVATYPLSELVSRLRGVTMLHDPAAFPYKDAKIQGTSTVKAEALSPCQCYVSKGEYLKVHKLRHEMLDQHGIDILKLGKTKVGGTGGQRQEDLGFVEFKLDDGGGPCSIITILPPIVETSIEADHTSHLLINDGMHRCFLARMARVTPEVIVVDGVAPEYPYYAFPLPRGWDDVQMVDKTSDIPLKKYHRVPGEENYKKLYRNFNSAFTNVGGPRG